MHAIDCWSLVTSVTEGNFLIDRMADAQMHGKFASEKANIV